MKMFLLGMLVMYLGTSVITLLVGSFTKMCEDTFLEYVFMFPFLVIAWIVKPIKNFITCPKTYIFCFVHGINPWSFKYSKVAELSEENQKNLLKHFQKNIRKKLKKYLTILRNDVILTIEREVMKNG